MILRFQPGATEAEREAVRTALEGLGVAATPAEGILHLSRPLEAGEAVPLGAMPGVAALLLRDPRSPTLRELLLRWIGVSSLVVGLLVLMASLFPALLGGPPDPLRTPSTLLPSWPLLPWYAAIDRAPAWVPVTILPLVGAAVVLGWPLLARRFAERHARLHTALGVAVLLLAAALALLEVLP